MKTTLINISAKCYKELSVIDVWLKSNKLSLNYSKTYFVPLSNERNKFY